LRQKKLLTSSEKLKLKQRKSVWKLKLLRQRLKDSVKKKQRNCWNKSASAKKRKDVLLKNLNVSVKRLRLLLKLSVSAKKLRLLLKLSVSAKKLRLLLKLSVSAKKPRLLLKKNASLLQRNKKNSELLRKTLLMSSQKLKQQKPLL